MTTFGIPDSFIGLDPGGMNVSLRTTQLEYFWFKRHTVFIHFALPDF
jgi:hypothetical protein